MRRSSLLAVCYLVLGGIVLLYTIGRHGVSLNLWLALAALLIVAGVLRLLTRPPDGRRPGQ